MITIGEFADYYGVPTGTIYNMKYSGRLPSSLFVSSDLKKGKYIDDVFIIRRYEFKSSVVSWCQDMLQIMEMYHSPFRIAKMIAKYIPDKEKDIVKDAKTIDYHLRVGLIQTKEDSILNYKVHHNVWRIFRYFRHVLIKINKEADMKFNPSDELDRLMHA